MVCVGGKNYSINSAVKTCVHDSSNSMIICVLPCSHVDLKCREGPVASVLLLQKAKDRYDVSSDVYM